VYFISHTATAYQIDKNVFFFSNRGPKRNRARKGGVILSEPTNYNKNAFLPLQNKKKVGI